MISSDRLEPGAVSQIKASVNTAGRKGRLIKHFVVYSNDRSNPALSFSLIMNIVQK